MARTKRRSTAAALDLEADLRLDRAGHSFLGGQRIRLLESIAATGSITQGARGLGLSYKGAWDTIESLNNLSEQPLVKRASGGAHGGGTRLTSYGEQLVRLYRQLEQGHQRVLDRMQADMGDPARLTQLIQTLALKSSARNQLRGTVNGLKRGAVNADVLLDLGGGLELCANITLTSVKELGLKRGRAAVALIKANFVMLAALPAPRVSARNRLQGTITAIKRGAVNTEVKLTLPGGRVLVSIVSREGFQELALRPGAECCAIIQASQILIAVND